MATVATFAQPARFGGRPSRKNRSTSGSAKPHIGTGSHSTHNRYTSSRYFKSEAVRRCGFDPSLRQLVDWELWLRLAKTGPLAFVDESLGVFRVHPRGASASNNRSLRTRREFLKVLARIRQEYGADLSPDARRRLRREEWRCRRHLLGGLLGLSSS